MWTWCNDCGRNFIDDGPGCDCVDNEGKDTMTQTIMDMAAEDYFALDAVSASDLKALMRSPLYYQHYKAKGIKATPAMQLGTAAHMAILEPERFASDCVMWDGAVRRGKVWDAFCEQYADKTILTVSEYDACCSMAAAVRKHEGAVSWLTGGNPEVVLRWDYDGEGSMPCKCRIDWMPAGAGIVDLKTTADPSPRAFSRTAANLNYHMQLAWYRRGYRAVKRTDLCPVKILAVQNQAPWDVVFYDVPEEVLARGDELCDEAVDLLGRCEASGNWFGADGGTGEQTLWLPAWAMGVDDVELDWTEGGGE